jgi:hypothetical protein
MLTGRSSTKNKPNGRLTSNTKTPYDLSVLSKKGEVGEQAVSESAQQKRLRAVIKDWFSKPWAELQRYKIGIEAMRANGVIPYSYISKRLTSDAALKNAKLGATAMLKKTIKELFDCGELQGVSPKDAQERFNTTSECYAPSNFDEFIGEGKRETECS